MTKSLYLTFSEEDFNKLKSLKESIKVNEKKLSWEKFVLMLLDDNPGDIYQNEK